MACGDRPLGLAISTDLPDEPELDTDDPASSAVAAGAGITYVQSPLTPHPGTMAPPPPPGEPPWLLSNKRPHGSYSGSAPTDLLADGCSASASTATPDYKATADNTDIAGVHSSPSPSGNDTCPSSPDSSSTSEDEVEIELDPFGRPEIPPGPPPAEMAPPPPSGPPPSLPLDRAELKRGVEEPTGSSPNGKRLRSFSENIPVDDMRASSGSPSDGEDMQTTERDVCIATRSVSSRLNSGENDIDISYAQSSPSVRWVWDRFLQKDGGTANAAVLERRMLSALDALALPDG